MYRSSSRCVPSLPAALASLALCGAAVAQSLDLSPRYQPGVSLYLERDTTLDFDLSGGAVESAVGAEMNVHSRVLIGLTRDVKPASNKQLDLALRVDRVAVHLTMPVLPEMAWDSDGVDPPGGTPALDRALRPLIGMSYVVTLAPDGSVTGVRGVDEIAELLRPHAQGLPVVQLVASMFKSDRIRREWGEDRSVLLPGDKIRVGESWKRTVSSDLGGSGELLTHYRCRLDKVLSEAGKRFGEVSVSARVEASKDGPPLVAPNGAAMELREGSIEGAARFSEALGEYTEEESEGRIAFVTVARSGADSFNVRVQVRQTAVAMLAEERAAARAASREAAAVAP